jgi:hypothetical protein
VIGTIAGVVAAAACAAAGPVEPLVENGAENRIVVAILGDGYAAGEQAKLSADAAALTARLLATPPYAEYRALFTFRLVHVESEESGAGTGAPRRTALRSFFGCGGVDRLLCADVAAALELAEEAVPGHDVAVVLVNDARFGGAGGGAVATVSAHPDSAEVLLHEIAHTLAGLADEYEDSSVGGWEPCSPEDDCGEPNATIRTARAEVPWAQWIAPPTPVPTPERVVGEGVVGLFEGGRYRASGVFRPVEHACRMRALDRPYCSVCAEALVRRFWTLVAPIDAAVPRGGAVLGAACAATPLAVRPAVPADRLAITWLVDGALVPCSGATLRVGAPGDHVVTALVSDRTPRVRDDPDGALQDSATWSVRVPPCPGAPPPAVECADALPPPALVAGGAGTPAARGAGAGCGLGAGSWLAGLGAVAARLARRRAR